MTLKYTFSLTDKPDAEAVQIVNAGLGEHNAPHLGTQSSLPLSIFVRDEDAKIVGGLLGETHWGWLHISVLWLRDDVRSEGLGRTLMEMAEQEASRRGCKHTFLETFSFQAPDFYKKLGYVVFGQLDDMPPGHQWYYMKKNL